MSLSPLLRRENSASNSSTSLRNYHATSRGNGNPKYLPLSPTNSSSSPYLTLPSPRYSRQQQPSIKQQKNTSKDKKLIDLKSSKLSTLNGVTLPTILNVLSILMFLRFGFIIGQMGILGTIGLLLLSYLIDLLTTLSVSAIATNGIVKGGGAYYMLSRSLGVEFGGAIGVIFYIGQILNSSMNVAGLIEPILYNFNENDGVLLNILPVSYWWQFFYCSLLLLVCIVIALIGSNAVSKAGTYLCIILILSTMSIPISALFVAPFKSNYDIDYTGLSLTTLKGNLFPHFTKGAAGSQIKGVETFNDLFGIFFPATAGILAGTSMSGDLKNPSKSIPNGTLTGLLVTFSSYFIVILSMGASIPRELLYKDTQILQGINLSPFIILAGEMSTSIFSIIVGIVGASKLLQAIAKDEILPGLGFFTNREKESIILTWIVCQLFLFSDLNQIATFITMAFLMTFIVTNISCALLRMGSAPNFRPSFKYFSTKSALFGTFLCLIAMFVVDGISASIIFITLILLIIFIHFISPPKSWGDVSQSLIYHQVRKYLLKLRQDNVKYWRPQILLLIDNPRTSWNLISFCNNLKKGGLYILGHVFIINEFQNNVNELTKAKDNWIKIRDISKVKAFVQMSIAPSFIWGVRNIFLGSGLGGMKPNITIIGFYDLNKYKGKYELPNSLLMNANSLNSSDVNISMNELPTDERARFAPTIGICEWVEVLEDLSLLNSNIAVATGFDKLEIPKGKMTNTNNSSNKKKYIDLYPIQMAQRLDNNSSKGVLTTNFDTCTLILQMGAILHTVPDWKKTHIIRVIVFVEEERDVKEEKVRVRKLLEILRMQDSEIVVISLESYELKIYNYISKGIEDGMSRKEKMRINELLKDDEWWNEVSKIREGKKRRDIGLKPSFNYISPSSISKSVGHNNFFSRSRRMTMSKMNSMGISLGHMSFQANKFSNKDIKGVFDNDGDTSDLESLASEYSETSSINELKRVKKPKQGAFTAERMPVSTVREEAEGNETSIMFEEDDNEDDGEDNDGQIDRYDGDVSKGFDNGEIVENEEVDDTVEFGDMSRRCQFVVLNEMMRKTSNLPNTNSTALIFSTLPTPSAQTHLNEKESVSFCVDIGVWTQDLPAMMLLNATTVTVTTAL